MAVYIIYFYIFIVGLMIGSFLNCFIWRLYKSESLWNRSYCPKCSHRIAWYDNIPLISYLVLRAKCRNCQDGISVQYPLVELFTGLLFLAVFYKYIGQSLTGEVLFISYELRDIAYVLRDWFIVSIMVTIFIYDLRWYLIPDKITLPAIVVLFFVNLFLGFEIIPMLVAAFVGGGFFLLQFIISKGRWIGGGDVRLGFLMGIILSWPNVLVALMLAYISGSIIGVGMIAFGKKEWGSKLPFGTFLAVATIVTIFFGNNVIDWYLGYL